MLTQRGTKYLWKLPQGDPQAIWSIAASYNLSYPIAQLLLSRGYSTKDTIDSFLFSSFEKDVAHPSQLKDVQKSVDRILKAIQDKEKILVCGDYDVDGITSSALMMICLLPLGADINFFLPHRLRDGYGLSTKIVERAAQNKYSVLITVDNGITAFEPALKAKELGIDLIITDHHKPHEHLPEAYAIVNPNQIDCNYPFKSLAGVGVTFKLLSLLYEVKGLQLPAKAYELLLLGTVADVVPLLGENRFWVRYGLNYINKIESLSLKMLKQNGKVTKPIMSATDIGFSIAPQINALGRLEDARQGVKFLIGSDVSIVKEVGAVLHELNQARKEIERVIVASIELEITSKKINLDQDSIILASSTEWTPGVIGLVASRFVGGYGKPTLLFHITKEGKAKGSCRSIPEFDMFKALTQCADLIDQFGGHPMAAGLSLPAKNLASLKERLQILLLAQISKDELHPKIMLDAEIKLPDLTKRFIDDLAHLEPFGAQNNHPQFYVKEAMLVQKPVLLKDVHVKCSIFAEGVIKPVIFFNRPDLFELFNNNGQNAFDLAVKVSENHWNGKISIELQGLDVAFNNYNH